MTKHIAPAKYRRVTLIDRAVEVAQRWWPIMTAIYGAVLAPYLRQSAWIANVGWVDAAIFGFAGALVLTALTLWIFVGYRLLRPLVPPARDRKEFMDETVNLADLVAHAPLIYGKTFVRCVVRGLGQVKLQHETKYLFCSIAERNIVELAEGTNITGAVLVVSCTFVECYFDVAIVGTPADAEKIRGDAEIVPLAEWESRYTQA